MVEPGRVRLQDDPDDPEHARPEEKPLSEPLPPDSLDINVEGRELSGPERGFGKLWRKDFRVRLTGTEVSPESVVRTWRERFGEFWPEDSQFYRPLTGLDPGEVALADLEMMGGARLSTGVVVSEVTPTSFTLVTTEGHTMAGRITFSADTEAGETVARVFVLMRASDPLFEIGMPLGGHRREERFWETTLRKLAEHFGVDATPEKRTTCVDPRRQWRRATNIVDNAMLHTALYMVARPFRRLRGRDAAS